MPAFIFGTFQGCTQGGGTVPTITVTPPAANALPIIKGNTYKFIYTSAAFPPGGRVTLNATCNGSAMRVIAPATMAGSRSTALQLTIANNTGIGVDLALP